MTDDFAELEAQIAALQQNNRWKKEDAKQATGAGTASASSNAVLLSHALDLDERLK